MDIADTLRHLASGRTLTEQGAEALFGQLLAGVINEPQIAALLSMLALRGVTIDELTGAARQMRAHVTRVPFEPGPNDRVIDTCGTGGAPKTFNISTAAAIVAASAETGHLRVRVAKHGNRSRTGRGSAEVLAALGVNVDATPHVQGECLREAGVCFCFAIHHHPAAKHAAAVRRALGFPTIFNLLGPLTNPAAAPRQVLGIYRREFVPLVAHVLARLGAERAMVVHGFDGLDEITTTSPTHVAHVEGGNVREETFDAESLGVSRVSLDDLREETIEGAADAIRRVLAGESGPKRDIVLVNAAAAVFAAGACDSMREGLALARRAIDSGDAGATLTRLAELSHA